MRRGLGLAHLPTTFCFLTGAFVAVPNKLFTADMQRVYKNLAKNFGEEYALLVMFTMRTGVELHRVSAD